MAHFVSSHPSFTYTVIHFPTKTLLLVEFRAEEVLLSAWFRRVYDKRKTDYCLFNKSEILWKATWRTAHLEARSSTETKITVGHPQCKYSILVFLFSIHHINKYLDILNCCPLARKFNPTEKCFPVRIHFCFWITEPPGTLHLYKTITLYGDENEAFTQLHCKQFYNTPTHVCFTYCSLRYHRKAPR